MILRCKRVAELVGIVPVLTFRSEISEVEIRCIARTASFAFQFIKRGELVREMSLPFARDPDLTLFALSYSSTRREIRLIVNDVGHVPVKCNLGWLDAMEITNPISHREMHGFVQLDWVFTFTRLLSPAHCMAIRSVPTGGVAESMRAEVSDGGFPD